MIQALITFFQYNPVVQVSLIQEFPTQFPAVTVCNLNPFADLSSLPINQSSFFDETTLDTTNIDNYFDEAQQKLNRYVAGMSSSQQQAIGFQLNKTLISCSFNKVICDSSFFTQFFDYDYGNCYTFNGGEKGNVLGTTLTGSKYGLTLEILTGDPLTVSLPEINKGLLLVVHNQTKTLVPSVQLVNGINMPPGYNSYVTVSRDFHSKLSSPYSNCITDLTSGQNFGSVLSSYMTASGISTYDQPSCIQLCYQTVVQSNCNCYDPKYPSLGSMNTKCLSNSQVECVKNATDSVFSQGGSYLGICGFDCPIECNTIDYFLSSSSAYYPSQYYVSILNKKGLLANFNTSDTPINLQNSVRNYLVKFTVNYNQLGYTYLQEQPSIDIFSLVGTVGGQFGLFLGLSILSFVETLELLIDIIIFLRERREAKKQSKILSSKIN